MILAFGGKALGANEDIVVVQYDSAKRLEAVVGQLVLRDLQMTENSKFCDFAIVHGTRGLALDCEWLHFEPGEIAFRTECQYVENLEDFATEYYPAGWVEQMGHGFMLKSGGECEVWLDFNTGRTIVSLKS